VRRFDSFSRTFNGTHNERESLRKEYKFYLDEVEKNSRRRDNLIAEGAEEWHVNNAVGSRNKRVHQQN
jgi:hypothetical protein